VLYVIFRLGNGKDLVSAIFAIALYTCDRNSDVLAGWMTAIAWLSG
jgi:hypothetical protein